MAKKTLQIVLLLGIMTVCLTGCVRQSIKSAPTLSGAMGQLKSGEKVRIVSARLGILEGKFRDAHDNVAQVSSSDQEIDIPFSEIESVAVRRGSVGAGARGGGIALGVLGALTGLFVHGLCQGLDESDDPQGCPGFIVTGALVGATAGGLLGAGLGAASRKWRPVYPCRPDRQ